MASTAVMASGAAAAPPVPFSNPPEVASVNGVLSTTLTIQPAQLKVANEQVTFPALYNGLYTPPVLRVQPGDTVQLLLNNFVRLPTNLHYHGFNVTPQGAGDNVFIEIDQGGSFQYDFPIPANHPQGLYWYHPHFDPFLNTQISGGMAGGIIVGDILAPFPSLQGIPERVMLLKDLKTEKGQPEVNPDPTGPTKRTINGLFKPRLEMQPGQLEFWRLGNQSSNIFYELTLDKQPFYIIAVDGNLQNQAIQTQTLLLPPGSRLEVLVYGPTRLGPYQLKTERFDTGPAGDHYPAQVLMTVDSKGSPVTPIPIPPPSAFPAVPNLSAGPINQQRTIVFADTADPNLFTINGKPFNMDCVDTVVNLGDVEEWTIQNTAQEAHVFHIHQLDFQVTEVNGQPKPFTGYQDVVTLPPATSAGPSVVKVLIPFTDPVIVGKFVYHCHIIQHEDQGMMAVIQVVDPAAPPSDITLCQ
ncbi:MAG TPA: multicopper oxidase family protein [Candidatus Binatia bacterium]|nr:multicopper oxidase family protein [Candidatus Binatia bacterium]